MWLSLQLLLQTSKGSMAESTTLKNVASSLFKASAIGSSGASLALLGLHWLFSLSTASTFFALAAAGAEAKPVPL